MNEVKIQIPDNCVLIKDGDTYIVKEKDFKPKSWVEFCKNNRIQPQECFINNRSEISQYGASSIRGYDQDKNLCASKEEAEAFLALMQLRQLRKAWVGDWEYAKSNNSYSIISKKDGSLGITFSNQIPRNMLFPTKEMADDFLNCFRGLCETAKILL